MGSTKPEVWSHSMLAYRAPFSFPHIFVVFWTGIESHVLGLQYIGIADCHKQLCRQKYAI
jgi:hypothetical protein